MNENEIAIRAKEENEAGWKTKKGFDRMGKKLNWNEHPKKPDQAKVEDLKYPHFKQALATKNKLKGF